jgi:hypothetical protein
MDAREPDPLFEEAYRLVEPITMLMKAQVRSIYDRLLEVKHLPGDAIEFGAYRGGLSFFLGLCVREMGLRKKVFMLDSFQGLPTADPALDRPFAAGTMAASLDAVTALRTRLGLEGIVEIRAGWFEDAVRRLPKDARYCLAHLDADLYASTRTALDYVLPRLSEGGAVVLDDCLFHGATGVLKAARETCGENMHLHLGPKTQAFLFPRGDPRPDRAAPVWKTFGGQKYDLAELLARRDYLELVEWEAAFFRERAQWYRDYLDVALAPGKESDDSYRVTSTIGIIRRQ